MYMDENDNRTPRERVDDTFLRRVLGSTGDPLRAPMGEERGSGAYPCEPSSGADRRLMGFPLGMVYSPVQEWKNAYDVKTALERGTLFRDLDKPWEVPAPTGKGGCRCD